MSHSDNNQDAAQYGPIDTNSMWSSPSDTDIHDMQALEGAPYIPSPNNPYIQAAQEEAAQSVNETLSGQNTVSPYGQATQVTPATPQGLYGQSSMTSQYGQGTAQYGQGSPNPYAQGTPQTQRDASREPVPSPPQQSPYIPRRRSSVDATAHQPALHRRVRAQANPNAVSSDGTPAQQPAHDRYKAAPPKEPRPRKRARHGFLSLILWLIMVATYGLLSLRLLPADYAAGRLVPELASFVPLAIIPAAICFVLALLWHRRLLVVVSFVALAVNLYWHAGYFIPTQRVSTAAETAVLTSSDTSDSYARIMTINTLNGAASSADIVRVCREQNVEVLCLQEMTDSMVQDLINAGIEEVLPYSLISEQATSISNGGRNAIYTKAPMSNVSRNLLPIDTSSMPAADITIGNQTVRFVSVHPNSPVRGAQDLWDEGLSVIGSLSNYNHSYVVMGDFNSTWDHARFRELLGTTFVDASQQSGEGFHMTYPSSSISLNVGADLTLKVPSLTSLIEIDHIVYSNNSGIVISSLETVRIGGTDHLALLATLEAK